MNDVMRHKWVGENEGWMEQPIEENVLCMRGRDRTRVSGTRVGNGGTKVTADSARVTCRQCLRLMPIPLIVETAGPGRVVVKIVPDVDTHVIIEIEHSNKILALNMTNEEADQLSENLHMRANRRVQL